MNPPGSTLDSPAEAGPRERPAAWPRGTLADVRVALRGFCRAPTFVATVVLTIALGLGLNTAVFTVFDSYVLRRAAVRDPGSLYEFAWADRGRQGHWLSWRQYEDVRALSVVSESFGFRTLFARLDGRPLLGMAVTGEAFRVLGAVPELGRTLLPEDAQPGAGERVVVLSDQAWHAKFGGDRGIVGRTVRVRGVPLTVVGVLSPGFSGLGPVPPDFWAPMPLAGALDGGDSPVVGGAEPALLRVVLRLRPGTGPAAAQAALSAWARRATADAPDSLKATGVYLTSVATALPLTPETIAVFAPAALALLLVLLIACVNVANVMLARGIARQREIGIRLALGGTRRRLIRQLLTESVLLALPAAAIGYAISQGAIDAGVQAMFASMPAEFAPYVRVVPLVPDARVFAFMLVATLLAALLFGLVPALQATRPDIVAAVRGEVDTALRTGRLRGGLVVAQIGGCVLLLVCTGVLLRGAGRAQAMPTGMRTGDVVQITVDDRYRAPVLQRLRADASVRALAGTSATALDVSYPTAPVRAAGDRRVQLAAFDFVSGRYFPVLGIALLRGRTFSVDEERDSAAVAVVSAAAARLLWPGRDAIGQTLGITGDLPAGSRLARVRSARVIGVAANAVSGWIGTGLTRPVVYFPAALDDPGMRVLARVGAAATSARGRLDRELGEIHPAAVTEIHGLDDYLAVQRYPFHVFGWVAAAIGAIALLLTIIGVYGVLAYLVAQRTREIGIRMALGAGIDAVVALVLRRSLRLAAVGSAVGLTLAVGVSGLMANQLPIVDTFDPVGYLGGVVVILAACVAASVAPSRRAARVDPMQALRAE